MAVNPSSSSSDPDEVGFTAEELRLRAGRIKQMTFKQYQAIRAQAIELGVPREVASVLPWLAADPQDMLTAMRAASSRPEIIVRGVVGTAIEVDVMVAVVMRSLENLRAEGHRYRGLFNLPRYGSTKNNTALHADLSNLDSDGAAIDLIERELAVVDSIIDDTSPYGEDIRLNGIRTGGWLFPLVLELPGDQLVGAWDSADCYSRTLFAQQHSGIGVSDVLESLRAFPPTTPAEFRNHPLKQQRNELMAPVGKIAAGSPISDEETRRVLRAVMPKTTLVLNVNDTGKVGLDEIRRRLVSERHLDKPLEFTPETINETRARAVIRELHRRGVLPDGLGRTQDGLMDLLENPGYAIASGTLPDDVAAAVAATFLPTAKSKADRAIYPAIATRGVIPPEGRGARFFRSELGAQVIMRAVPPTTSDRDLRRSALERLLRSTKLKGMELDDRSPEELLADAEEHLARFAKSRASGEALEWSESMRQLALRGGFYLICGKNLTLKRSPVGGKAGNDNREPNQIIETLATTPEGLQQLVQAVHDGRRGLAVRKLSEDQKAVVSDLEPAKGQEMTNDSLRTWLSGQPAADTNHKPNDAAGLVEQGRKRVNALTSQLGEVVESIGTYADKVPGPDDTPVDGQPHVQRNGMRDEGDANRLRAFANQLDQWNNLHQVVQNAGTTGFVPKQDGQ